MTDGEISIKDYCERLIADVIEKYDSQMNSIRGAQAACRRRENESNDNMRIFYDARLESVEKAIALAATTMEKRLDGMNEFRETLRDQASKFTTRAEVEIIKETIDKDLRILRDFMQTHEGKASQSAVNLALIVSVASLLLGLFGIVMGLIR